MLKRSCFIRSLCLACLVLFACCVFAAEKAGRSWGEVQDTTGYSLIIKEYGRDAERPETEYFTGSFTEFKNAKSVDDIMLGSIVDIDYVEKDGRREAVYVYVDTGKR